jgi:glycosyltransferase involved in cell wall biosynthesis
MPEGEVGEPILIPDHLGGPPRRARVLMFAYACSPNRGSEPGVGWNRAAEAARYCDVWVVCEETRYAPPIRDYLESSGPVPGVNFVFVPKVGWTRRVPFLPGMSQLAYHLWHRRAFRVAARLHREVKFDLVHQVTFCGYREPSLLWKLGVPFVWGPVGGTQNYPWRFLGEADPLGAAREVVRSAVNLAQLRFSPRVRPAARAAAAVLAANSTVQRDFARVAGVPARLQLETGVRAIRPEPRPPAAGPLKVLWSGDLECWKGLPLLLRALAALPADTGYELRVLGKGRLDGRWRRLARRLGVDARTTWTGWLPFREALAQYEWADVLAFTSLRDTSGNVVLEALAGGVPVVCLDHQGVRDIVTPECGIKVPVTRPAEVVAGLTAALDRLARDPGLRGRLGRGALARARYYHWSEQGERMAAVYREVLARRGAACENVDGVVALSRG